MGRMKDIFTEWQETEATEEDLELSFEEQVIEAAKWHAQQEAMKNADPSSIKH